MNSAIKLLFGLILLASMVSAASVSIDSTDSIPAGTLWTVSIDYELDSKNEAKIFFDNELLITIFEYNGKAFVDESQNSGKILNYTISNDELTLSITGMQEGIYDLEAKLYSNEEKIDSDSIEIEFYNWQDKINSLESANQLQSNLIKTLQADLNAKALEIESLKINNQFTIESLKQINSNISTLQESDVDKNTSLEKINLDLNKLLTGKELESGTTGFFGLTTNPLSWVALLGLLALMGVGVVLYNNKKKKEGLY